MGYVIIDRRAVALGGQRNDRARSAITTIGWHYTAVMRANRAFITSHEAYWKNTHGWDRGGYHFYIDADANIYQNYDYERITWGVADNNGYVVHISVEAGNGNDYSPEQVAAREWLTRKIMADLNIPASKVKGHWEIYNNTSCPGYTKAQMDAFRAVLAKPSTGSTSTGSTHTVAKGDTLYGISKKYNTTVASIKQINGLTSDTILVGQKLNLTGGGVVTPAPAPAPAPAPVVKPTPNWYKESGKFTASIAVGVRSQPSDNSPVIATYYPGESVNYDSYMNDGTYVWVHYVSYSGADRYLKVRFNGEALGTFSE